MKSVFVKLGTDFLSTIVFLVVYVATDNVIIATLVAIASKQDEEDEEGQRRT